MKSNTVWFIGYKTDEVEYCKNYLNKDKELIFLSYNDFEVLNLNNLKEKSPLLIMTMNRIGNNLLSGKLSSLPKRFLSCIVVQLVLDEEDEVIKLLSMQICDVISGSAPKNYLAAKLKFYLERATNRNLQDRILQLSADLKTEFTKKEIEILMFITNRNHLGTSRVELTEAVWDGETYSKVLDVHLFNLRKKLVPYNLKIYSKDKAWYITENIN